MNFYVIWGKNVKFVKLCKHNLTTQKFEIKLLKETNKQTHVCMAKQIINEVEKISWGGGGEACYSTFDKA